MRFLFIVLLLTGCSSTLVEANVTRGLRPAEGVEVSTYCPQIIKANAKSPLGRTDARGHFEFREQAGGWWIHDGCDIFVGERRIHVKSICQEYSGNHCIHAVVTTDLDRPDVH